MTCGPTRLLIHCEGLVSQIMSLCQRMAIGHPGARGSPIRPRAKKTAGSSTKIHRSSRPPLLISTPSGSSGFLSGGSTQAPGADPLWLANSLQRPAPHRLMEYGVVSQCPFAASWYHPKPVFTVEEVRLWHGECALRFEET